MECNFCAAPLREDETYRSAEEHVARQREQGVDEEVDEENFFPTCDACRESIAENDEAIRQEQLAAAKSQQAFNSLLLALLLAAAVAIVIFFASAS